MAEVAFIWQGVEEASAVMRSIGNSSTKYLYPELRKILKPYRTPIRREAPKGPTGNLRKGVGPRINVKGVAWVSKAQHTHLVYQGKRGYAPPGPPNPFLHRAVGRYRKEIVAGLEAVIMEWKDKAVAVNKAVDRG